MVAGSLASGILFPMARRTTTTTTTMLMHMMLQFETICIFSSRECSTRTHRLTLTRSGRKKNARRCRQRQRPAMTGTGRNSTATSDQEWVVSALVRGALVDTTNTSEPQCKAQRDLVAEKTSTTFTFCASLLTVARAGASLFFFRVRCQSILLHLLIFFFPLFFSF